MSSEVVVLNAECRTDLTDILGELSDRANAFAVKSRGDGTRRAYKSAWDAYMDWCQAVGRDPLDSDPETLALYVTARAKDLTVSSITVAVAAIREAHRLAGRPIPHNDVRLSMVLEGIRRAKGTRPARKAAPAVPNVLWRLLATRQPTYRPAGARDRAMMLVGFGAALRRSELVALRVGDVMVEPGYGLIVTIARSKADQHGEGREISVCQNPDDPEFCPVLAYERWMIHRKGGPDGACPDRPLFCAVNRADVLSGEPLCDRTVSRLMKHAARMAGMEEGNYSGHSLRRGFATAAARAGVGLADLMQQTRHTSIKVALGYIDEANRWKDNASASVFRGSRY
ncbi:MAG: site-specific integrase [Hyphomicrobiaceae bacterium]